MNDINTYTVFYKTRENRDNDVIETIAELKCDKDRYIYEIEKAVKNRLSFTASDGTCCNDKGGTHYWVSIYIW